MGAAGCVSWSFDRKGVIVVNNEDGELEEDKVMEDALEAGAEDIEDVYKRQSLGRALMAQALDRGASDNVTIVILSK